MVGPRLPIFRHACECRYHASPSVVFRVGRASDFSLVLSSTIFLRLPLDPSTQKVQASSFVTFSREAKQIMESTMRAPSQETGIVSQDEKR